MAKKVIIEIVSVVFAVLLALGLNHWREAFNEQKLADQMLSNLFVEIHSNRLDIDKDLPFFNEYIEYMKPIKESFDQGNPQNYNLKFSMTLLSNSAWDVANSTGAIKNFDLELLLDLSDLYTFQDMHQENGRAYFQIIHGLEFKKAENDRAIVTSNFEYLYDYYHWSMQLSNSYKDFLTTYADKYGKLMPDSIRSSIKPD